MKIALILLVAGLGVVYGRDLSVSVISGEVKAKDTFHSDPYVSVSVCRDKARTPTISRSNRPVWNWSKVYKNAKADCRIKFHLYDDDIFSDDTIGELEFPSVTEFLRDGGEERTLYFGKHGDSKLTIRAKYIN